jgi:hypothetical protein
MKPQMPARTIAAIPIREHAMTQEADLAHAIHAFHDGGLSRDELLARVDDLLAKREADAGRLLDFLDDERIHDMLPSQVFAELRGRIVRSRNGSHGPSGEETRVLTRPERFDASTAPPADAWRNQPQQEPERVKGVGDTLNGRFVLEECIGFGGMGTVYKALDLRKLEASDRKPYIAIKVLNVQFRGHPKSLIALQREARKAQTLAHPNIVTVYDFDRDGSTVFLTMELLSGKPLSQTLRAQGFSGMPYPDAMRIVGGIAKGLEYAHERGFVHCDLKPANVFMTEKGEVKVIDFGIARVFHKPEEDVEATVFDPGSLGAMTPAYASPEMQEHKEPDPRDDIYALACITYELLTGRHPFDRLSALQARGGGMRPQRPKNLGHRQWRALKCALSLDRETRTPTVTHFMQEMRGDSRVPAYAGVAVSSLVLAALFAAGLNYLQEYRAAHREHQATSAGSSEAASASGAAETPALSMAGVAPLMARVPCSALNASVQGSRVQVQGFVPKSYGKARLQKTLGSLPGAASVDADVIEVEDDECGVVEAFAPYWIKNRQASGAVSIRTRAPNAQLTEGDPLVVDIATPAFDSYVNLDYYQLDGSVVHMVPSPRAKDNQAPPNYAAAVGTRGNWVIAKPFGSEMVVLLITPVQLFDGLRPEVEARGDYLKAVQKRLKQIASTYGEDKILVDMVQISTKPKS